MCVVKWGERQVCDRPQRYIGERVRAPTLGIVPVLAAILIAATMTGCSTLMGPSQFSGVQPDAALVEPNWGGTSRFADGAEVRGTDDSTAGGWTTRIYQYRGGRNPKTGLAKIQM